MSTQGNNHHARGTAGESSSSGPSSATTSRRSSTAPGGSSSSKKSNSKQPVRIGQYTLQQTLGTGSFGKVKLATHSVTGHRVAMKIINRRTISSLDMGGRVKREIQYLKLLRHPHIIKLYEVITTPSDIIMVIEYAGGELFQYIVDRGRMSEDEGRRFFQQIICAIEYCHRHKIVHRDLKPENLLLDEHLNVKIGDFGLSNIMTDGDFLKTSCGSPNYAAPEVISGKLYAGPEIDIWSCGVILYVMLCGRLPFDDEYIPTLFKKINGGIYSLPSYLSSETKHLLSSMLVVDPVKRITVAEIRQVPWFQQNLPHYLQPLPPTPAAEPLGFDFRTSKANGNEGDQTEEGQEDDEQQDIGTIDDAILAELADKMVGFSIEELKQRLMEQEENQVKVAYHLVRDHKRMLQTSHLDQSKEMEGFLAQDPPAWNAGLDGGVTRSTSIRRKGREGGRSRTRSGAMYRGQGVTEASATAAAAEAAIVGDENTTSELEGGNATDEVATEGFGSDDEDLNSVTDEDETGLFTEDDELDESSHSHSINVAILKSSIIEGRTDETPVSEAVPAAPTIAVTSSSRRSRNRWHFGIRSRSPPMEIMLELYRTLQVLGMEWRAKPQDEKTSKVTEETNKEATANGGQQKEAVKNQEDSTSQAEDLFFIETRWKVDDIIARMNLQLYRVDETNYLVDFRNVGYVRMNKKQDGELDSNVASPLDLDGHSNVFNVDQGATTATTLEANHHHQTNSATTTGIHEALENAQRNIEQLQGVATTNDSSMTTTTSANAITSTPAKATPAAHPQTSHANAAEGRKEVCSPFLFLECATRLIVELAGGGG